MIRSLTFRQSAAAVAAVVGVEAILSAATPDRPARHQLIDKLAPLALPSAAHLLALLVGLGLVVISPKLWRGTRAAVTLTTAGLVVLAVLNLLKGLDYEETALELCLAAVLLVGRGAFPLGCRKRLRLSVLCAAVGAWALCYCLLLVRPLITDNGRTLRLDLHNSLLNLHLSSSFGSALELFLIVAAALSLLALWSLLRPAPGVADQSDEEHLVARQLVDQYGDSIAPFILRPDKALHFDGSAVVAYRVIGETAVVSGEPVGPPDARDAALASFRELARAHGWQVVLWGAGDTCLERYRASGMHAVCAGEEAFVRPAEFTLEGRRVRKLRQSVHRLARRGWAVEAFSNRALPPAIEAEIDTFERRWRRSQKHILGFSMSMGHYEPVPRPGDLYLLGRAPSGELRAVMRFTAYPGGLSLDTMHRLGETPNGLNEALLCRALEQAQGHVEEVSLNYAGLAHIVRSGQSGGPLRRIAARLLLGPLQRHFQMARLVRFDEKFFPEWRPRYLVYDSPTGLPRAVVRVLQAEGYVPEVRRPRLSLRSRALRARLTGAAPQADGPP